MLAALTLLLTLANPPCLAGDTPGKHALLVAVADYPDEAGYKDLHADNDIGLMQAALRRQGFRKADIAVLQDQAATREGILAGIAALAERAEPGDIAVVHYSGHGHQITDDDGDELDGYDEVLVPWGAPVKMEAGYAGELHLRDDDLGAALAALRARLGPDGQLLVTLDSCYSGSATRGAEELPARGVTEPLGPAARGSSGDVDGGAGFDVPLAEEDLAPVVIFSAASHAQLAHETRDRRRDNQVVGGLSLAFSHALNKAPRGASYRELFEQVKAEMARSVPRQTPQLEGQGDMAVLRGELVEQVPWLEVLSLEEGRAVVQGGTLMGLMPGSELAFHAPGTRDPTASEPLASGTVASADAGEAVVTLPEGVKISRLEGARAFVTHQAFGDLATRVQLAPELPSALRAPLEELLATSGVLRQVEEGGDLVLGGQSGDLLVTSADGLELGWAFEGRGKELLAPLEEHLVAYARNRYLARLDLRARGLDLRVEVVPAVPVFSASGAFQGCEPLEPEAWHRDAGQLVFHPGEAWLLRLGNQGPQAAWVTVLDLGATGAIQQLYPVPHQGSSDHLLGAGQQRLLADPCFVAEEPFGNETVKLFATRVPTDFEPLLFDVSKAGTRGEEDVLGLLLDEAWGDRSTRAGTLRLPAGSASTHAVVIRVEPSE
jgi:hypothetical protein